MKKSTSVAYIDMQQVVIFSFLLVLIIIAALINKNRPTPQAAVDGPMTFILEWPEAPAGTNERTDLDLWAMGPDGAPIGYSAKEGPNLTLLHDDLGYDAVTAVNHRHWEKTTVRTLQPGEYVVNVHSYGGHVPQDAWLIVQLRDPETGEVRRIFETRTKFDAIGDEKTLVRFTLDSHGRFVPDSLSYLPVTIRNKK